MNEAMPILENENEIEQSTQAPIKELRACRATMILLVFISAQIIVGAVVGIVGIARALNHGQSLRDPGQLAELTQMMIPPAVILGLVGSGIVMVLISLLLVRHQLKDNSPMGAAWILGSSKRIAQGLAIGLLIGVGSLLIAKIVEPRDHIALGPIAQMAVTPGLSQLLWIISVLLLAPPIEELLFRGILYGGYRRSFGPVWAGVLTTSVFVICHLTEVVYFLPSIVGITGLAIAALWLRLRAAAIGPAVAAHFGYNAVLAIVVANSTLSKL